MAAIANKTLIGFIVDASFTMEEPLIVNNHLDCRTQGHHSKLDLVKSFLNIFMCTRCAESKTIEFSVTTFGQDPLENENHLTTPSTPGYEGVHELFTMCHPSQDAYHLISCMQTGPRPAAVPSPAISNYQSQSQTQSQDQSARTQGQGQEQEQDVGFVSSLIVAFDAICNERIGLQYNRVLVLITDGEKSLIHGNEDFEDLNGVIGSALEAITDAKKKRMPIVIHVIVIGKCCPVAELIQYAPPSGVSIGRAQALATQELKCKNAVLLKDIAARTGGVYAEADTGLDLMWALSCGTGLTSRPQLQKTVLTIARDGQGSNAGGARGGMEVPCLMWALTQEKKPSYLTKKVRESTSPHVSGATASRGHVDAATATAPAPAPAPESASASALDSQINWAVAASQAESAALSSPKKAKLLSDKMQPGSGSGTEADDSEAGPAVYVDISRDARYISPENPLDDIVIDDLVEGYRYGAYHVPVDAGSKETMHIESAAGLTALGFLPREEVPRYHSMEPCWVLQGTDIVKEAQLGIAALARAMRCEGRVLIARKVQKENSEPYLVALLPPEIEDGTLLVQRLPCVDDSRFYTFASLPDLRNNERYSGRYASGMTAVSAVVDALTVSRGQLPATHLNPVNACHYRLFAEITSRMLHQYAGSGSALDAKQIRDRLQVPLVELLRGDAGGLQGVRRAFLTIAAEFPLLQDKDKGGAGKGKGRKRPAKTTFSDMQLAAETGIGIGLRGAEECEYSTPPAKRSANAKDGGGVSLFWGEFDASRVEIERLDLSAYDADYAANPRFAVYLHNILSPEECEGLIALSERRGYEAALVNVGGGREIKMENKRNNDRAIIDDEAIATEIYKRVCTALTPEGEAALHERRLPVSNTSSSLGQPPAMATWRAVGFNERLRFLRYDPGTYFAPHMDGSYQRNDPSHPKYGEKSLVTAQIYLNEGFEGGATRMMGRSLSDGYDVVPRTGSVLVFQHDIYHEGSVLRSGRKYTIRTDVMYTTGV